MRPSPVFHKKLVTSSLDMLSHPCSDLYSRISSNPILLQALDCWLCFLYFQKDAINIFCHMKNTISPVGIIGQNSKDVFIEYIKR